MTFTLSEIEIKLLVIGYVLRHGQFFTFSSLPTTSTTSLSLCLTSYRQQAINEMVMQKEHAVKFPNNNVCRNGKRLESNSLE